LFLLKARGNTPIQRETLPLLPVTMLAREIRSLTITLLLFAAAGLVIAASAWTGGGQVKRHDNAGESTRARPSAAVRFD
jgi:hypothetical protein